MKATRTSRYCQITVRRPNGQTETMRHPKVTEMTPALWAQFCSAMAKAGRGEGVSYQNLTEELPLSLEEQRDELVYELVSALDARDDVMTRGHASSVFVGVDAANERIRAAEAAIAAFDAAHPEILAAWKAEEAAAAERNQWN